jgi:predicted DNA-binding transcriptional regulator YafY
MDILKYGPECRVVAPKELAGKVAELARETAALYR